MLPAEVTSSQPCSPILLARSVTCATPSASKHWYCHWAFLGGPSAATGLTPAYIGIMQLKHISTVLFGSSLVLALSTCGGSSNGDAFIGTGGISGSSGTGGVAGTGGVGTGGTGGVVGTGGTGVVSGTGGSSGECHIIQCAGRVTDCGNCIDDDEDGLVDNDDPECLGPCDNYEGEELLSGVGGETGEQCKADCYFDFGNGAGNDDCHWSRSCDPLEPKVQCTYDAPTPSRNSARTCVYRSRRTAATALAVAPSPSSQAWAQVVTMAMCTSAPNRDAPSTR